MLNRIRIILASLAVVLTGAGITVTAVPAQAASENLTIRVMTFNLDGGCIVSTPDEPFQNRASTRNGLVDAVVGAIRNSWTVDEVAKYKDEMVKYLPGMDLKWRGWPGIHVAMFQQITYNQYEEILSKLREYGFFYYGYFAGNEPPYTHIPDPTKKEPCAYYGVTYEEKNALISILPIDYTSPFTRTLKLDAIDDEKEVRTVGCAKVQGKQLQFCTTHLSRSKFETTNENQRTQLARDIFVTDAAGKPTMPIILGGDLNSSTPLDNPELNKKAFDLVPGRGVWDKIFGDQRWDHILVSRGMVTSTKATAELLPIGQIYDYGRFLKKPDDGGMWPDTYANFLCGSTVVEDRNRACSDHPGAWIGSVTLENVKEDTTHGLPVTGVLDQDTVKTWGKVMAGEDLGSWIEGQDTKLSGAYQPGAAIHYGSGGSPIVKYAQQTMKLVVPGESSLKEDGLLSEETIYALQKGLGLPTDPTEFKNTPSVTICALQERLRQGIFLNPTNPTQVVIKQCPDTLGVPPDDIVGAEPGPVKLSLSSMVMAPGGQVMSAVVTSGSPWRASADQTWLKVTASGASGDSVTVTARPNWTGSQRTAQVTVSAGGAWAEIDVTQESVPGTRTQPTDLWRGDGAMVGSEATVGATPLATLARSSVLTGEPVTVPAVLPGTMYASDGNGNFPFGPNVVALDPTTLVPTQQFAFSATPHQAVEAVAVDAGATGHQLYYMWSNTATSSGVFSSANETPVWFTQPGADQVFGLFRIPNALAHHANVANDTGCFSRTGGGVVDQQTGVLYMWASWCPSMGTRGNARIQAFDLSTGLTYWSGQLQPLSGAGGADDLWSSAPGGNMGALASGLVVADDGGLYALVYRTDKTVPATASYNRTGRTIPAGSTDAAFLVKIRPSLSNYDWAYEVVGVWLPGTYDVSWAGGMALIRGGPRGFAYYNGVYYVATDTRIYRLDPASPYYYQQGLAGRNVRVDPANPAPQGLGTIPYGTYTTFASTQMAPS